VIFSEKEVEIIAEVKTMSPFGWKSEKTWDELFKIADAQGDMISIHTDARWGGSFELIRKARAMSKKPILAKGIHAEDRDIVEAFKAGADWVLVVGRVPRLPEPLLRQCIIEPNTLAEIALIPGHLRVLWNSRDLATGGFKKEIFEGARALRKGWLCQASNIRSVADIKAGADAVLVGTHLEDFVQSMGNIAKL
jgi:indole-3-glycerol phosphate synthase